jgi:hypothetical protein
MSQENPLAPAPIQVFRDLLKDFPLEILIKVKERMLIVHSEQLDTVDDLISQKILEKTNAGENKSI